MRYALLAVLVTLMAPSVAHAGLRHHRPLMGGRVMAEPILVGPAEEIRPRSHRRWKGAGDGKLIIGMQDLALSVDVVTLCDESGCWVDEYVVYAGGRRSRLRHR